MNSDNYYQFIFSKQQKLKMFAAMNPNPTPMSRDNHKKIVKLIQTLLAYQESNIFRRPIPHKSLGWQDYKTIVKKPTDLNFVRRQYGEGKYKSVEEVLDQIQLIWDNVFIYGKREHESYEMALKMVKHFDELLNDLFPEYHQKLNRTNYFKQFQPLKTEKKSSNNSNTDKNARKVEKMDLQNVKQELKQQKNLRGSIPTRRRQQQGSIKHSNEQLDIPVDIVDNVEKTKKKPESQQKIVQNKKSSSKIHQIDIQEPMRMEQKPQNKPVQPLQTLKKDQKVQNKQSENYQNSLANVQEVQNLNRHHNTPQNLSIQNAQPLDAEDSQQNQFPPIAVNLNKTPSSEEVFQITQMMRLLFELHEMQTLSKIVKILTQYEKQNMIIDGEDVNFRMNEIHISTYTRVRKELEDKISQLQHSQKIKDLNRLKEKLNIKLVNGLDSKMND